MRRIVSLLSAIVLGLFGAVAVGSPSLAAQNCVGTRICFYDTSVSSGPFEERDVADASPGENFPMPGPWTSWVRNQTSRNWRVFKTYDCTGFPQSTIYANTAGAMNSDWNNQIRCYERI